MKISKLIIIVLSIVILLSFIPIINYYINSNINKTISFSTDENTTGDLPPNVYDTLFNGLSFDSDDYAINVNYVLKSTAGGTFIRIGIETNLLYLNFGGFSMVLHPDNTYSVSGGSIGAALNSEYTINYTIDTNVNKLLPLISFIVVIIGITTIVYYIKFD